MSKIHNLAFYHFVELDDPSHWRDELRDLCEKHRLMGTILLSNEGINAMLAGPPDEAGDFVDELHRIPAFRDVPVKISESDDMPFGRLVVKVKPEIVTMRVDGVTPSRTTARHLPPEQFREWIRHGEDMVVIDTRNDYEFQLGTFRGSINPETAAFHEFPEYIRRHRDNLADRKIVMFCTGGIRCEKATSWMLEEFEELGEVYQLEGGVLNYFEAVEDAEKDWEGELFVFDQRVAIDTKLRETETILCEECGVPVRGGVEKICAC